MLLFVLQSYCLTLHLIAAYVAQPKKVKIKALRKDGSPAEKNFSGSEKTDSIRIQQQNPDI